jgi:hypothetical protein
MKNKYSIIIVGLLQKLGTQFLKLSATEAVIRIKELE